MKVFISNDLSELANLLHQKAFLGAARPFEPRWIITPSEEEKLDLYLKWAEKAPVVTGIKTITYKELIRKIFPDLPSQMELALRIEVALDGIDELSNYLNREPIRRLELATELSSLFLNYLQRPELTEWLAKEGWQQKLWKKVFGETLPTANVQHLSGSFFFYHITSVTPYEWEALSQLEASWFLFSPSQMYIGDLISDRKKQFLLEKTKGAALEYFEDETALLSNWITHIQPLFRYFEDVESMELFKEPEGSSSLQLMKRQWLNLQEEPSIQDFSMQVHSAATLLDEVEVVWELIQRLDVPPREVIVVAPDIQLYAQAIEWVFKQRGGAFDYSITGIAASTHSPLLQGLEILLSLPSYRFSREVFKKLLLSPPFLNRFNLTLEEGETVATWMEEMHLRYDMTGHMGSWHSSLSRALEGLAAQGTFDFSETPLINRWIDITQKLEVELAPITDGEKRSGGAWARMIEGWVETFFLSEESADVLRALLSTLHRVEGLFSYETIEYHLKRALKHPSESVHGRGPDSIRFTSMREGALMPAKVIICMGMQEGAFPRLSSPSSLPQLPIPLAATKDRYLFLEAVSHAKEHFITTYVRCHPDDGKEQQPSSMIQELVKDRGAITTIHHPQKVHAARSQESTPFVPLSGTVKKSIDLKVLRKLARHPVQCFLEESVGVRFPFEESDSEFLFSPLEMHQLRKKALEKSNDELIDELNREGKLPIGAFRTAALNTIEKELESYRKNLAELGIDPLSVYSLELTPHAKKLQQVARDLYVAPPVKIGEGTLLTGTLEGITPEGMIFHGEEATEDLLKVWPLYVTLQVVQGPGKLFLTKRVAKSEIVIENPQDALDRYGAYLQKNMLSPSPLLPAWGARIFKGGDLPKSTEDKIISWAEKRNLLPEREIWVSEWREHLLEVVRELI